MSVDLSSNERKILDAMERHTSVKEAAIEAGIDPHNANTYLYRIRRKKRIAQSFVHDLARREKRSKLVAKILMERR